MSLPRPLFFISLAFLLGIAIAALLFLPLSMWLILAGIALLFGFLWHFLTRSIGLDTLAQTILNAAILLTIGLLGAARFQAAIRNFDAFDLAWYNDRDYDTLITGWVTAPPDQRDHYANLRVRATHMDTGDGTDLSVSGLLLARVDPDEIYSYGEVVRLRGRLKTPSETEDFSYKDYLARQGVYSTMTNVDVTRLPGWHGNPLIAAMYALKGHALATIYRLFPDPEASLLAGILLGVDSGLPDDLQQAFKDTGTSHIIAISGFNIAIIAELFLAFFGRVFGKRRGAVFAGIGIIFYTLLVGAEAAVVRAAVMGIAALFARHFGRRQDGIVTLFGIGALMNLYNPYYLQDVGFQLSFAATLGLILYGQALEAFVVRLLTKYALRSSGTQGETSTSTQVDTYTGTQGNSQPLPPTSQLLTRISSIISDFFLLTLAAQVTTIPIMAYHFNRLSLVSFIANPFILPVQPAVMILGGLADILGMIFLPLGQLAAYIAWPFVAYTIRMVEIFGSVDWAAFTVDFPFVGVLAWYAALLGLTVGRVPLKEFFVSLKARLPKIPVWGAIAALTLLAILIWRVALSLPDGKLHITFLDAGSSDAVLIETPSGDTILVNGGESISKVSTQLGERLPPTRRSVDWLIVASTRENEVASLPRLVERYRPGQALWAGNVEASLPARTLHAWLTSREVRVTRAEADQSLDLGDGARLTVLAADERGAVLLIEYGNFRAILPVGMSLDAQQMLMTDPSLLPVTALLLADSGYAPINTAEWIDFINPQVVILSVAADDANGLPSQETLDALGERTLLRTDVNGWISISSDGRSIWVETQKPGPSATPSLEALPTLTEEPFSTEEPLPTDAPLPAETFVPSEEPLPTGEPPTPAP